MGQKILCLLSEARETSLLTLVTLESSMSFRPFRPRWRRKGQAVYKGSRWAAAAVRVRDSHGTMLRSQ